MASFINELKRRNVIKATIAYAVVSWVLLQVLSIVLPSVHAPEWVLKTAMLIMVIGFPIWVFFAWVFEVTPEGIKKTSAVDADKSVAATTNKRLNILILATLIIAIALILVKPNTNREPTIVDGKYAIAILPFDDMSPNNDNDWFCDGVTEDILTYLSKVNGLRVISRTSVMQYKNHTKTIPQIAKELGVSYILEGSVRKQNNRVLITAQLIKANDEHVWAENYNKSLEDVFKIQGDVSKKIVQQLKLTLSPKDKKKLETYPTQNIEAYQLYLKGRNFLDKVSNENIVLSRDFFKKAIALDPNYADAYAELGYSYLHFDNNIRDLKKAEDNINKALELNPNSSRANFYKGMLLSLFKNNHKEGLVYFEKAIEQNPNDSKSNELIGTLYMKSDPKKALLYLNKALAINPFSTQSSLSKAYILISLDSLKTAKRFIEEKKNLFTENQIHGFNKKIKIKEIKIECNKQKDLSLAVDLYKKAIEKDSTYSEYYYELAVVYDGVLNDDATSIIYAQKAFKLDSTSRDISQNYHNILVEGKRFKEAQTLLESANFRDIFFPQEILSMRFYALYHQERYKEAQALFKDSLMVNNYSYKTLVFAQLGDRENIKSLFKNHNTNTTDKAFVYAILKQRDKMYSYLAKKGVYATVVNSRREFDPYRKEAKFKAFLKNHYIPVK